jgi:hypothetical protein
VEKMNYLFYREDNKFEDILNDNTIKKYFRQRIRWKYYLLLISHTVPEEAQSYLMIKYGDDMKSWDHIRKDNSPIPYKDYLPDPKRPEKFKNVYK